MPEAFDLKGLAAERTSSVYFVQAPGGLIKIGTAIDVAKRFSELQVANPGELRLLGYIPGNVAKEQELHARFADLRERGEWFREEGELAEFIDDLQEQELVEWLLEEANA